MLHPALVFGGAGGGVSQKTSQWCFSFLVHPSQGSTQARPLVPYSCPCSCLPSSLTHSLCFALSLHPPLVTPPQLLISAVFSLLDAFLPGFQVSAHLSLPSCESPLHSF